MLRILANEVRTGVVTVINKPLSSSKNPHFQNEAKRTTFLVTMSFICMRMKIISLSKAEHLTSFWYRGLEGLGNGLLQVHSNKPMSGAGSPGCSEFVYFCGLRDATMGWFISFSE